MKPDISSNVNPPNARPGPRTPLDAAAVLLAQWFGAGSSRFAPGTVGSIATFPVFLLLGRVSDVVYWAVTLLLTALGVWASGRAAKALGEHDPSSVVIDEVSGTLIALGFVRHDTWPAWFGAFVLFRFFDIKKPWLIDRAQTLKPDGLGIMADDVIAGFVAGLLGRAAVEIAFRL